MRTIVWAFRALPELAGKVGFVECDERLALELIAQDRAQSLAVGALHLREIELAPIADTALAPQDYATTQLTARTLRRRSR